jgi:hypothetical protein
VIEAHRLRAPRQPGGLLAEPPLAGVEQLLNENRRRLGGFSLNILGTPFPELARAARQALVAAAREYAHRSGEPWPPAVSSDSLLLAGHQPELFHPGVWVKNFALNGLARAHGATPVNLVVDNDTLKSTAFQVPGWEGHNREDPASVRRFTVPFDHWTQEVPYEERAVLDEALFSDFPSRVAEITRDWNFEPLLPAFWQEVLRQGKHSNRLGERFAGARRAFERLWGCHNLEVPLSSVDRTEPFAVFALHLLADLPRFHGIYNDCVREYRRLYGIRSRAHPVPDLAKDGDWWEAPFWAWKPSRPQRQRLMARTLRGRIELRMGAEPGTSIPFEPGRQRDAIAAWQGLEEQGLKVRSRALTTTLFARFLLADLFIHGIGGAKYDELTDAIARRFYGVELPGYMVLSATLLLPLPGYPVHPSDCRRLAHEARDVHWNPQRHLEERHPIPSDAYALADDKQHWINTTPVEKAGRRQRFHKLQELTQQLRPFVAPQEGMLQRSWQRCVQEAEANAVLQRRDYAFCLFSEAMLREYCTRLLDV